MIFGVAINFLEITLTLQLSDVKICSVRVLAKAYKHQDYRHSKGGGGGEGRVVGESQRPSGWEFLCEQLNEQKRNGSGRKTSTVYYANASVIHFRVS